MFGSQPASQYVIGIGKQFYSHAVDIGVGRPRGNGDRFLGREFQDVEIEGGDNARVPGMESRKVRTKMPLVSIFGKIFVKLRLT